MQLYYVISSSPDGVYMSPYTRAALLEELANEEEGIDTREIMSQEELDDAGMDPTDWPSKHNEYSRIIIKGTIVKPTTKEVVTAHDID